MPLTAGTRLDNYEIIRPLGEGGMGEVYLARDTTLNRTVAIKVLPADVTSDPHRVARFEQEARAASALNHPNVCTIHALGVAADGRHFIAMEHVEGQTLRDRLTHGALKRKELLDVAIQIASALTAVHAAGVVHRDLKPENVMLRPDGFAKVLDFGLAKLVANEPDPELATRTVLRTDAGIAVGTVAYMSPEQARGERVDARTDVWTLGVVLYEMIAGRRPFAGQSTSEVLAAILDREPEPLARCDPEVPHELERIVTKALRKDPEQRYQVMKDLLLDLQALHDELAASSVSGTSRPTQAPARKKSRRGLIVTAAVLLTTIVATVWWLRRAPQVPAAANILPVDRPLTRLTFDAGLQTDPAFSPDGRAIAYASDRGGNFDIWIESVSGGDARQLTKSPAQETQPNWSPDGRSIVYRSEGDRGGLFIVPVHGGPERHLSSFGVHPEWSPDGSEILFRTGHGESHQRVYAVSPDGGDPPREILGEFLRGGSWTWIAPHPDGRISVLGIHPRSRFGFYTVSRNGKQVTSSRLVDDAPQQWTELQTRTARFQWDAAGTALYVEAFLNEVRNVWRVRVDPTTLEWLAAERLTSGTGPDVAATLSPDGKRLAFTIQRQTTRLWSFPFDAAAGRIVGRAAPLTPEDASITMSALSPEGRRVAYSLTRAGKSGFELWIMDIDRGTRELFAVNGLPGAWSPDGMTLAYNLWRPGVPSSVEWWALAVRQLGGPERIVGGWSKESVLLATSWTPDGRSVLGSYASPFYTRFKLALWRIPEDGIARDKRIVIDDPGHFLHQATFSPDGKWLSFVAVAVDERRTGTWVAPADGALPSGWIGIASDHDLADKPRWAPDGRTLYFISKQSSSFFNLWAVRFDPVRGVPVGHPFMITRFDSPGLVISPEVGNSEIGIAQRRAVLTMATVTGNIWMLENVDR